MQAVQQLTTKTTKKTTVTTTTTTTASSSCCNCAALAKIQQSLNDLVASSCQSPITSTKTSTRTTTVPTSTKCVGHYWPIENQKVTDTITGKQATSLGSPQFAPDRNGIAYGAILINSTSSVWQLPADNYFQGDTSVSMWINNKKPCTDSVTPSSVL
jgi:hypothetical protein